jgi:plastocyanin
MKRLLVLLAAVAACAAVAVPAFAGTRTVKVGDNWFLHDGRPATLHVHRDSSLRFDWTGSSTHNVVVAKGPQRFRSPVKTSGTYSHRFTRSGRYLLLCTIHPSQMRLNVVVR